MRLNMIRRRKELNLTQEEVAKMVGIARNTYTGIELGKNTTLKVSLAIKRALQTDDDDIFLNFKVPKGNGEQKAY